MCVFLYIYIHEMRPKTKPKSKLSKGASAKHLQDEIAQSLEKRVMHPNNLDERMGFLLPSPKTNKWIQMSLLLHTVPKDYQPPFFSGENCIHIMFILGGGGCIPWCTLIVHYCPGTGSRALATCRRIAAVLLQSPAG